MFDADHVPVREFLNRTVGYFREDPKLFLCQTPHFFTNPDPLERNLQTFQSMPSENEMFYGIIQKGLDKWNGAFFCGSAAVIRREALDLVGGFSGITITEDCETALDLHARGWNSMYVDRPMISGLQPETFASFIGQRSRWARGMFQIFLLKNPILKRGLSVAQKICYLSNMTYWFFPIFRLPFLISPASVHLFQHADLYRQHAGVHLLHGALYGRQHDDAELSVRAGALGAGVGVYEYVQTIYLARGLLSVVMNPYKPTFNVTDKGNSLDKDHLSELSAAVLRAVRRLFHLGHRVRSPLVRRARGQRIAGGRGHVEPVQSVAVGGGAGRRVPSAAPSARRLTVPSISRSAARSCPARPSTCPTAAAASACRPTA